MSLHITNKGATIRATGEDAQELFDALTKANEQPMREGGRQEARHTPGPWVMDRFGAIRGGPMRTYNLGQAQSQVALATLNEISEEERTANARLIAAAPELLEALKQVVAYADRDQGRSVRHEDIDAARAAIARAERGAS